MGSALYLRDHDFPMALIAYELTVPCLAATIVRQQMVEHADKAVLNFSDFEAI